MPSKPLKLTLGLIVITLLGACASPYDGPGRAQPDGLRDGLTAGRVAGR